MNDLISRQALKAVFRGARFHYLRNQINKIPSVDAVEVVRCKECKWKGSWYKHECGFDICGVSGFFVIEDNAFCSYGERKEGEANE